MSELRKWGDDQQYEVAPMQGNYDPSTGVMPRVHLLSMSPDPLGEIAAACLMYEGKPVYDLSQISDEQRMHYWRQAQATHLKAPLEYVHFHFMLEGVDRAFTHQLVRQRTAVYAQESMRFAVMGGDFREATSLPPSLHGTKKSGELGGVAVDREQQWRLIWDDALLVIEDAYERLVEGGMPAEEARGLLPHAMATRVHYDTNLRNLLDHAGNRLCTQAQFHWRLVFAGIAQAIGSYGQTGDQEEWYDNGGWQFKEIAKVFRPVCYEQGKCPFKASFDRNCSIRDRVDEFAAHGVPSSQWHLDHELYYLGEGAESIRRADDPYVPDHYGDPKQVPGIYPEEWLADPAAARSNR